MVDAISDEQNDGDKAPEGKFDKPLSNVKESNLTPGIKRIFLLLAILFLVPFTCSFFIRKSEPTTTIVRIVSAPYDERVKLVGKEVTVQATILYINRQEKLLIAYTPGMSSDSTISIDYEGTNMQDYFLDNDPTGFTHKFSVTGEILSTDSGELYIKAKTIQKE